MTSQTRKQITAIRILSCISGRKDNRKLKFGELSIEYNMRSILFEKPHAKCGGETIRIHFFSQTLFFFEQISEPTI